MIENLNRLVEYIEKFEKIKGVGTREVFFALVQCNMLHPTNLKRFLVSPPHFFLLLKMKLTTLLIMSLGQWSKIDLNQFCSIVPGTKSACLLGISLTFCPVKQKLKPWDTHFFSCVGGMEHVALHQREKNFSCPHSFILAFFLVAPVAFR